MQMRRVNVTFLGIVIVSVIFACLMMTQNVEAITLIVDNNGPADHNNIQGAVDAAVAGDAIMVYPGVYNEHVLVTKQVSIIGEPDGGTIVSGEGSGDPFTVIADGVTLSGITIRSGKRAGVVIKANDVVVRSCLLEWNTDGILFDSDDDDHGIRIDREVVFGGTEQDALGMICPTDDGGYALVGATKSLGGTDSDFWLVKIDKDWNHEWDQVYDKQSRDEARGVLQTSDGGYLIVGFTEPSGSDSDFWLVRTDDEGNVEWDRTYGSGVNFDRAYCGPYELPNGDFIIGGYDSYNSSKASASLLRIDADGTVDWHKHYGGSNSEVAWDVEPLSDGGFLLSGFTLSYGAGGEDGYFVRTDEDGNKLWDTYYGTVRNDRIWDAIEVDGRFLAVGNQYEDSSDREPWLIVLNESGAQIDSRIWSLPGDNLFRTIRPTGDGGFLLAGFTDGEGAGKYDVMLIKVDHDFNEEWSIVRGGAEDDTIRFANERDGETHVFGTTHSYGSGGADYWGFRYTEILHNISIMNCTIVFNTQNGISAANAADLIISESNISRNGNHGITSTGAKGLDIFNCHIIDNQEQGIHLEAISDAVIEDCLITGNHGSGISIRDRTDNVFVTDTNLSRNEYGMTVMGNSTNITAYHDHIEQNNQMGLQAELNEGVSVNAANTWWGGPLGPYHAIFNPDGDGDEITTNVNFFPWLTRPTDYFLPAAFLDSIVPGAQLHGNLVEFEGGSYVFGSTSAYAWSSDIDGEWANGSLRVTNSSILSRGSHVISLRVMDNFGEWSPIVTDTLIIHDPPTVMIDDGIPEVMTIGDPVTLQCHAEDDGEVVRYLWTSSRDGVIYNGSEESFSTSSLSLGTHILSIQVMDDNGEWSLIVNDSLLIHTPPTVTINEGLPKKIIDGDSVTFGCLAEDDGEVIRYVWTSSIDGPIYDGANASFSTSDLSVGEHNISIMVIDNHGVRSLPVNTSIIVEEKFFLYQEIGPFPIFYYLVIASALSLLLIILVIGKNRRALRKTPHPGRGSGKEAWPELPATPQVPPAQPTPPVPAQIPYPSQTGQYGGYPNMQQQQSSQQHQQPPQQQQMAQYPQPRMAQQQYPQYPNQQATGYGQQQPVSGYSQSPVQQNQQIQASYPQTTSGQNYAQAPRGNWYCPQCNDSVDSQYAFCMSCGYKRRT